jgi:GT2 family glycosyltransferase
VGPRAQRAFDGTALVRWRGTFVLAEAVYARALAVSSSADPRTMLVGQAVRALASAIRLCRVRAGVSPRPQTRLRPARITDPDGHTTLRRWVPRLRASDPERPGTVTAMAEGVVLVRRDAFETAGGWPGHFFLFHEGVDLAWRLWNLGHTGRYAPHLIVHHPATDPARHDTFYRLNARNRVWLARRNLPRLLIPFNLATWVLLTLVRVRSVSALRMSLIGFMEGLRGGQGERRAMTWRTVSRLTLAGRPPIV